LVNVASAENCVVAERYICYTCDREMWRYCKLILACGLESILPRVLTGFAEERFMRYNSDSVAPHSAITGIAESYKVE
jgi:hypothetical protein